MEERICTILHFSDTIHNQKNQQVVGMISYLVLLLSRSWIYPVSFTNSDNLMDNKGKNLVDEIPVLNQ